MCGYADTLGRGPQLERHFSLVLLLVAGTLNWWAFHPSPVFQGFGRAVRNSFAWQTTAFVERSDSNQPGQFKEWRLEYCVCDTWAAKTQATEKKLTEEQKEKMWVIHKTLRLHSLMLQREKGKHAAGLSFGAKWGDKFFTLQMVFWQWVRGITSVRQSSAVVLGERTGSTIASHLSDQMNTLKHQHQRVFVPKVCSL